MAFISGPDGDLKTAFISDAWLLDQFVGNTLFTWGRNSYGNLGDNTIISKSNPIQTIAGGINWKTTSCSNRNIAAMKTDGTLWCWGDNYIGTIGDNTTTYRSSPVQTVAFGTDWKQVTTGFFTTAAIKNNGTLWNWGRNTSGQLGDNTIISRSSPVQTVAFGINWKQVSNSSTNTASIKTDGTLWTWGDNTNGQLGDNTIIKKSSPVQTIAYGTSWKQVACGHSHTAAIKTDGTLWTWGDNTNGQLGDNTIIKKSSPVQTIAYGTSWKQVFASCGSPFTSLTAAIKTDGTLWTWGGNASGQLGDNTRTSRSSPIQTVTFGTNWKQVACGYIHMSAIKTDGTLWTWGGNTNGQLGDNTISKKSSPVQITAYGTNWKQVACGYNHTAAVTNGDI